MRIELAGPHVDYAVTAAQMKKMDQCASTDYGIPSSILMENAGHAVYAAAIKAIGEPFGKFAVVVAGPGNNGGDGFVVARHLHNAGALVHVYFVGDRKSSKGDALQNIEIAEKIGIKIDYSNDLEKLRNWSRHADIVIDALLGTGIKGDVRAQQADVISAINESDGIVISVDIPSGIDADTGAVCGCAVYADQTVTFAFPKIGLLTNSGPAYVGELTIADISIPSEMLDEFDLRTYLLDSWVAVQGFPARSSDAHKGIFGHVAIIAGSVGMTGAATLAAHGALRIGTGLVTVAVPESLNDIMEVKLTEAMTIPVPEGKSRAFGMASLDRVLDIIAKRDAVVIGPGFGRDEDTIAFTLELVKKLNKPAIIDADALFAISTDLSVLKNCKAPLVLTPHPGEMATLLGTSSDEVQSNRLEVARSFAYEHGITVVLKGSGTIIAEPSGTAYINTTGTPGMATGGTGDVLSGMIGGLLAQAVPSAGAAASAVYLHGRAGELAAEKLGEEAMLASDVADNIGAAIMEEMDEQVKE